MRCLVELKEIGLKMIGSTSWLAYPIVCMRSQKCPRPPKLPLPGPVSQELWSLLSYALLRIETLRTYTILGTASWEFGRRLLCTRRSSIVSGGNYEAERAL